ncbi:MAG TPA: HPr-rel-A system PqqD family peptide chaperone [Casimicrobiaceae bacterium]|nr:HPr-rel-A system PqqD family peptide chaperone [Casimicrobiaceae bacterium]
MERSIGDRRWQLARDAIVWREWDGEAIVYDERSGATHRLGAGPTLLFKALAAAPTSLSMRMLLDVVSSALTVTDEARVGLVEVAIQSLEDSGLVVVAEPLDR